MAKTIQILAGENQYIHGVYSKPSETSLESREHLLIVMVHGFPGNKDAHENVFKDFNHLISDKGYHTLCFDFRGCGESDGRQEDFTLESASEDFQNILGWAKDHDYTRFIFVCEGLGAPLTFMNAPEDALCFITLWPMLDLPRFAENTFKSKNIEDEWKKAGYALIGNDRIGIPFIEELEKTEITGVISKMNRPILVMHGAQDEVSPIDQLDIIRRHTNARRVEITSFHDGTHGLPQVNHRKTMFYHIMQFIEKYT